jgi:hypothetical protein
MNQTSKWPNFLLLLAFTTDLITPILIWKGIIPGNLRWLSQVAIAMMIFLIPFRMLAFNRLPFGFWFVIVASFVGILTATLNGQGISATIWGWWLMFQFPLVGIFAYLQPNWPDHFSKRILNFLIAIVGFEVLVQIGQYLTGVVPGDNLSGTFGQNGTGDLVLFLILVLCFAIGDWLLTQRWVKLIVVILLGLISSILGEMKLFYSAIIILGLIGLIAYLVRGRNLQKLIPILVLIIVAVVSFAPIYNAVVPSASEIPLQEFFTNPVLLTKYLTFVNQTGVGGGNYYYDIGRNYALDYGWNKINDNPEDLILGYGIGARAESKSLGIIGRGLELGELGVTAGTSILVIIQETGLFGIFTLCCFILIVIIQLFSHIRHFPISDSNYLRIGIILFTILWPVWLWYNAAWTLRVPMLIYWPILGFVMSDFDRNKMPSCKEK